VADAVFEIFGTGKSRIKMYRIVIPGNVSKGHHIFFGKATRYGKSITDLQTLNGSIADF
jgi:hypothetical protein